MPDDYYTGLKEDAPIPEDVVTVTITRTASSREGLEDLTVVVALFEEEPKILDALDEEGYPVELDETQTLLAKCLARGGVDETGR